MTTTSSDVSTATPSLQQLRLGTAPDSWGVWFPQHPDQVPWSRFLDEAAAAGYTWVELGPYGYLPTDPGQLRDELGRRGLRLSGGGVFAGLHRGPDALKQAFTDYRAEAQLLTALNARHIVALPEGYRDLDGGWTQSADLDAQQWSSFTSGMDQLGRAMKEEFDIDVVFHPHADSHVDTQDRVEAFLADTDEQFVNLCLDTGHIAYCGGDNLDIVRRFPTRIGYVHLKQVDPAIVADVHSQGLDFAAATARGAMVEPPQGVPAMEPLLAELAGLDIPMFTIVEQDMFGCDVEAPAPIAQRTQRYFAGCGLGPGPGRSA